MIDQPEWPDRKWHTGERDHLHALGVITSAFNELEFELLFFFMRYVVAEPPKAQRIFGLLSNHNIIDLIRDAIEAKETNATAKELALHFLKGYEAAEFNRNFLSHSLIHSARSEQAHLTFGKGSRNRPETWSFAHMSLPEIRKVADEMLAFREFGLAINLWLIGRGKIIFGDGHSEDVTLPDKEPLPERIRLVADSTLATI